MAANRIYIQVEFGTDAADQAINQLNKNILGIGKATTTASQQTEGGIKKITVAIDQATKQFGALDAAIAGLGIARLGAAFLDASSQIIRARVSLTALMGGISQAERAMTSLMALSRQSPFEFGDLLQATVSLKAFGAAASDVVPIVQILSDAAAQLGGSGQKLDNITRAIGQMISKGRINAEEAYRQLTEAGVDFNEAIRREFARIGKNVTGDEIRNMLEKQRIRAGPAIAAILDLMRSTAAGMGKSIVELDPKAQLDQVLNEFRIFASELAVLLLPAFKSLATHMKEIVVGLKAMSEAFGNLSPTTKTAILGILGLVAAMSALGTAFKLLSLMGAVLGPIASYFRLMPIWTAIVTGFRAAIIAAGAGLEAAGAAGAGFLAFLRAIAPIALAVAGRIFIVVTALTGLYLLFKKLKELVDAETAKQNAKDLALALKETQEQMKKAQGLGVKDLLPETYGAEKLPLAAKYKGMDPMVALSKMNIEELRAVNQQLVIEMLRREGILKENEELMKHLTKITEDALDKAEKEWLKYREDIAKNAGDTAMQAKLALQRVLIETQGLIDEAREGRPEHRRAAQLAREKQMLVEMLKIYQNASEARVEMEKKAITERLQNETQLLHDELQAFTDFVQKRREYEIEEIEALRDLRISEISELGTQTLQQERILAERTAKLRIDAANEIAKARIQLVDDALAAEMVKLQKAHAQNLEAYKRMSAIAEDAATDEKLRIEFRRNREILQIESEMRKVANERAITEQRKVFDSLKDAAGQVFDALLTKSTSIWQAIANIFKVTMLTALREVVSSHIANAFVGIFGGGAARRGEPTWWERLVRPQPVFGVPYPAGGAQAAVQAGPDVYNLPHTAREWLGSTAGVMRFGGEDRMMEEQVSPAEYRAIKQKYSKESGQDMFRALMAAEAAPARLSVSDLPSSRYRNYSTWSGGNMPSALPSAAGLPDVLASTTVYTSAERPPARGGLAAIAPGANTLTRMKESMNIGKPIPGPGGISIPWSKATPRMKMGAILGSPGFQSMAAMVGIPVALAGLQKGGVLGDAMAVGGGAAAGFGLAATLGMPPGFGAVAGAGLGLAAAGVRRGGAAGLAMTTLGGAAAGWAIGASYGGPVGATIGLIAGAAIGLGVGVARLFYKTADEKLRQKIKQVYGIDMPDQKIRQQILEIAKTQYGGNMDVAVRSPQVQEMIKLYSLATGQNPMLARPMYGASFAQSGAGLEMQPVYDSGRLVANPYTGVTTSQWASPPTGNFGGVFMQLNPEQANQLFEGRVVQVLGNNPAAVGDANASAARAGTTRNAQRAAFLEPQTVMR